MSERETDQTILIGQTTLIEQPADADLPATHRFNRLFGISRRREVVASFSGLALLASGIGASLKTANAKGAGENVPIVAVVDSGINPTSDMTIVGSYNTEDESSKANDELGHGTQMAKHICDKGDLSFFDPTCQLLNVKVPDSNVTGELVAKGIHWAANNGATIINLSYAQNPNSVVSAPVNQEVKYATDRGIHVVMSAGNNNSSETSANNWASSNYSNPRVLVVGAVDPLSLNKSSVSNYGGWVEVGENDLFTSDAAALVSRDERIALSYKKDIDVEGLFTSLRGSDQIDTLPFACKCVASLVEGMESLGYKDQPTTTTSNLPTKKVRVTVQKTPGVGSVISRPGGIDTKRHLYGMFNSGSTVNLTEKVTAQERARGVRFIKWGGACLSYGKKPVCVLKHVTKPTKVIATFSRPTR